MWVVSVINIIKKLSFIKILEIYDVVIFFGVIWIEFVFYVKFKDMEIWLRYFFWDLMSLYSGDFVDWDYIYKYNFWKYLWMMKLLFYGMYV